MDDVKFYSYEGNATSIRYKTVYCCDLSKLNDNILECQFKGISANDTIGSNLTWQTLYQYLPGYSPMTGGDPNLSGYNIVSDYNNYFSYNYWPSDTLYMALRMKQGDIYKYGWINFYIEDYRKVKVKEFGFEK